DATWSPLLDTGTFTAQGIPFNIYGSAVTCPKVKGFSIDSVATDQASFSWLNDSTATNGYNVSIHDEGDDPDTTTPISSDNLSAGTSSYTSGSTLQPDTTYDAYILAKCDSNEESQYAKITFTTLPICESVSNFAVTTVTDSTATLSWQINPEAAEGYELTLYHENKEPGIDTPILRDSIDTQVDSYQIDSLEAETTYDAYLYTFCSSNNHS